MSEACPHCGGALPTSPARICTWCYARVDGLPLDTASAPAVSVLQHRVVSVVTALILLWAGVVLLGMGLLEALRGDPWDVAFEAGVSAALLAVGMAVLRWGHRSAGPPTACSAEPGAAADGGREPDSW
jgi:hypothetical protein